MTPSDEGMVQLIYRQKYILQMYLLAYFCQKNRTMLTQCVSSWLQANTISQVLTPSSIMLSFCF